MSSRTASLLDDLRSCYSGRSVFVTGHTGFKGAWLSLWLAHLGARVSGTALAPASRRGSFVAGRVAQRMSDHTLDDIRDFRSLQAAFERAEPEFVFHLAAQPLVRESYVSPLDTFDVNAIGTAGVLECIRLRAEPCTAVIVTSDKCYADLALPSRAPEPLPSSSGARGERHEEDDRLGGHDPYSASKAVAELITEAYRASFFPPDALASHGVSICTARAGNVIGGGDASTDRIMVDVLSALEHQRPVSLRNPDATRPWQHVLEPLGGYLLLGARLSEGPRPDLCSAFNFGPLPADECSVRELVQRVHAAWGGGSSLDAAEPGAPYEAPVLRLSIDKAAKQLQWTPRWRLDEAIYHTVAWQRASLDGGQDLQREMLNQIERYAGAAMEPAAPTELAR